MSMTENVCNLLDNLTKHNSRAFGYELSRSEILQILKLFDDVKELEQYRAIGTVEDIEKSMQNVSVLLAENEVLKLYQAIGTIEEFKALKEKSVAKKPNNIPMDDTCIYYENHCPNCNSLLVVRYKCCPKCGQKLDCSK